MEKINCIQQYVIDNLIKDNKLSVNNLINVVSKVCSYDQFNNILSIIIESKIDKPELFKMNIYIPKDILRITELHIIKILKNQLNLELKEAKDYVSSCMGEFKLFPKDITLDQTKILADKLTPYNVSMQFTKLMQQKYCAL